MKQLLIRADDLGYSKGINYGIYEAVHSGIINNVGVMVNMPTTKHGLNLLKNEDVDLGLHTVICAGYPLSDPAKVSSIVDEQGLFKKSQVYRAADRDLVDLDEVKIEIEAQYQKFVQLVGRKPDYFEGHAVVSNNFIRGMEIVAEKYNVPFLPFAFKGAVSFKKTTLTLLMESMQKDYQPFETFKKAIQLAEKNNGEIPMVICHPGYLDDYILKHSSLTLPRTQEVEMTCSEEVKEIIRNRQVRLIKYSELN